MRESFIEVAGLRLRVGRTSKHPRNANQRPLLLINGLGAALETWGPLVKELSTRDVIAVDHPGMGRSQTPTHLMQIKELANIYQLALTELGVDRADVLGYSFGGVIAQQLAHDHPGRVNRLVLAATSCGWGGVPPDLMTLFLASNPLRYALPTVRLMSAPFLYRGRAGRDPHMVGSQLSSTSSHWSHLPGVFLQVAAFAGWSSLPWLSTLAEPTLVVVGSEDPMAPLANSQLLARTIPGAQLKVFGGGGHLLLVDSATEVAPTIVEFLDHQEAIAV